MNKNRTCDNSGAELTQVRSGPVRLELVGPDGHRSAPLSRRETTERANKLWPTAEQNEDGGWDVRVVGAV